MVNLALIFKLGWRILTQPNNLWVRVVHAKYLYHQDFFAVKRSARTSFAWKGILQSSSIFRKGMRWIVGNGCKINFWLYNWVLPTLLINMVPASQRNLVKQELLVAKVIEAG